MYSKTTEKSVCEDGITNCHFTYLSEEELDLINIDNIDAVDITQASQVITLEISADWGNSSSLNSSNSSNSSNVLVIVNSVTKEEFEINSTSDFILDYNNETFTVTLEFPAEISSGFYEIAFKNELGYGSKKQINRHFNI